MISQDILTAGLAAITTISGGYAVYMQRKSKRYKQNEEDSIFVENAEKLTNIWEKLSIGFQTELSEVKKDYKEINSKYTELKIEFEVNKKQSDFVIEQLKMQLEKAEFDRDKWKKEADELRDQYGTGIIKKFG